MPARPAWSHLARRQFIGDSAQGGTARPELTHETDDPLLGSLLDQQAVIAQTIAVGNRAHPLPARAHALKRRAHARTDQQALVFRERIHHAAHEHIRRAVRVGALTGGTGDPCLLALDRRLTHRHHQRITGNAIALGHQQHIPRLERIDRRQQAGSLIETRLPRDPCVLVDRRDFPLGDLAAGVELRVAAPVGEVGALSCRRDDGFMGYLDLQGRRLPSGHDAAGWWPTNDFARLDPSGHLEVLGRSDHSVNRDGLLVFFAEVERVIETLDSVASVAVTAEREEGPRGRRLIACCVAAADADPSPARIRAHCFDRLPPRAVPDEIHLIERLPLLANGKIDRLRLQAIYRGNTPGDDP